MALAPHAPLPLRGYYSDLKTNVCPHAAHADFDIGEGLLLTIYALTPDTWYLTRVKKTTGSA